jgi:hypothetical protein
MPTCNRVRSSAGALLCLTAPACFAQPVNVRVSLPTSTNPEEVTIAINPVDPQNLVAGANIRYVYFSTDGGRDWTQGTLSSTYGVYGDPCLIFDALGNAYYGHLSNPSGGTSWLDRIVVQKSTDGGRSWDNGAGIGLNGVKDQDKEWLAADRTNSPFRNNLYCAWTEFDAYGSVATTDSTRILFSRSTDGSLNWSAPVRVSDRGGDCVDADNTVEGAVPAVGPNGEVYIAWSGPLGIMFDRSTDGGATWGRDVSIAPQPGGWDFAVPGISRCNGLPVTACDVSSSPFRGRIYVLWSDQRNGLENTDIFCVRSTDGGNTWGGMVKVNDDLTSTHQFFPWLAVDEVTGYLHVAFYDRRQTTGNTTEVSLARSTDGGATFQNTIVSSSTFFPTSSIFFGDYIGIDARGGRVHPIWMRLDTTRLSVWSAQLLDTLAGLPEEPVLPGEYTLASYPNPFNPSATVRYTLPAQGRPAGLKERVRVSVIDLLGREIERLFDGDLPPGSYEAHFSPGPGTASGVYLVRLDGGGRSITRRLVYLR